MSASGCEYGGWSLTHPGSGRLLPQVTKRKGEKYKLFWREDRADFVRLAAKFDALIVPFAAVGGDDAFDLFMVHPKLSHQISNPNWKCKLASPRRIALLHAVLAPRWRRRHGSIP